MWNPLHQHQEFDIYDIEAYVHRPIVLHLHRLLCEVNHLDYSFSYSKCSMLKGWNIKYHKGSKNICTVYPQDGYLQVLIVLSRISDETIEALRNHVCANYAKVLLETPRMKEQRWLMLDVEDKEQCDDLILIMSQRLTSLKAHET